MRRAHGRAALLYCRAERCRYERGSQAFMSKTAQNTGGDIKEKRRFIRLALIIILIFAVMGVSIWGIAKRTYDDMSDAAIANLNENLNLMKSTIEVVFKSEADFQLVTSEELAELDDPVSGITRIPNGEAASLISIVAEGAQEGVSNNGQPFSASKLDFSDNESILGLDLSRSYVNSMGTWAYTLACPVEQDGQKVATLYMEYTFDTVDDALPRSFYGDQAVLYLMDVTSERFVLKPEGMGERDAGHVNLTDFYRANSIDDAEILEMVTKGIEERRNVMFSHEVRGRESLCFLWSVNDGATYLVGFVPMDAIQQEARAVNVALILVTSVTALAFCLCVVIFALNRRKQALAQKARDAERVQHAEQLAQALQAAQLANESKSAFLANMSHDIRTPMNAVLGFANIIGRESDNPVKVRDYAGKITASGRHLLDLINDVLDISKIESGKATLNLEEFDLGDSLSAVESIIAPMAADKGQTFFTEISSISHERVIGDETHLNQILLNLLSNAVKYTPDGGKIWLRFIGLPQRSEHRERIRIEVEDTGFGMTPEFLETIFDAFTRAENSTISKIQGTGLGMSITKSLVDLMGGTIAVESIEGEGSIFRVELELRIPDEQARGFFWERAGIRCILVVDPTAASACAIEDIMQGTGVIVKTASSIDDALSVIGEDDCDLILYGCEALDEESVCDALRLREAVTSDPVLLFMQKHGYSQKDLLELPPESDVLIQPFFPSMLKAKITALLGLDSGDASQVDDVLQGKRFLAAEDNFLNASILTDLLQLEGAEVEIVENGQLVVERFERSVPGEFDAILMDVQMPVMNGHDAARAIRALDRKDARTIPIFAMTADAFAEDEQAALAAGMDAHVAKPLEIEDLKHTVDRFIGSGQDASDHENGKEHGEGRSAKGNGGEHDE